ncbi:MAG: quinone oxidoreductase [Pseudomonadota bacterium]|nr:quinone oxidoreductase [Pseudomonadota bacterium]
MTRKTMQAMLLTDFGGPEVLKPAQVPVPEPGPGEVLVKLDVSGINYSDINWSQGQRGGELPMILGTEGAGTVAALGDGISSFEIGEPVAYWVPSPGSFSEYATCPAFRIVKLPEGMDFGTGAALMLQGLTAHYLVRSSIEIKAGETMLFHAGAGGVGQIAIQLGKAQGARVLVTVGSEEKAAFAKELGADEVILYDQVNFAEMARELTGGEGVHAVYDSVGAATWEGSLKALRVHGKVAYFGGASGPIPPMDLSILASMGSLSVIRTTLGHYVRDAEEIAWRAGEMFDLWREGRMKISVGQTYPLAEAVQALVDLKGRRTTGKLLLKP